MELEKQMNIKIPGETYLQDLRYTKPYFSDIKSHLEDGHFNDSASQIIGELNIQYHYYLL